MSRRIRVNYQEGIKEGNVMYRVCENDEEGDPEFGVIFDDGSTDTITWRNDYTFVF